MRVIAGTLRGKKLIPPKDDAVRPTTDRVKESLFNLLIGQIDDSTVIYDLFSGSGGLGIEALSRGARYGCFCDKSKESYQLTKENIRRCRLEDRSIVVLGDFHKAISRFPYQADIVFLDPPYQDYLWKPCLEAILEQDRLKVNGIAVLEHGAGQIPENLPEAFVCEKQRRYCACAISIYSRQK